MNTTLAAATKTARTRLATLGRITRLAVTGAGGFRCPCCNRNRDRHPATSRASKARARRAESGAVRTRIREADRREVWD